MISGKTLVMMSSLLLWSANISASEAAAPAPASSATLALISALGQPAPAHTAFAEARFMQVLDRPLVISGELAWLGDDKLQRRVEQPKAETFTIADGEVTQERAGKKPRHFSLSRAPQLQVLLDSFVALLSGDPAHLQQVFAISHHGDPAAHWTLSLVPRDTKVARTIAAITINGYATVSRCMQMHEADGDLAVDLLGPLAAKMPAQPTRESLLALCGEAP
jgi:hypothetical protein